MKRFLPSMFPYESGWYMGVRLSAHSLSVSLGKFEIYWTWGKW